MPGVLSEYDEGVGFASRVAEATKNGNGFVVAPVMRNLTTHAVAMAWQRHAEIHRLWPVTRCMSGVAATTLAESEMSIHQLHATGATALCSRRKAMPPTPEAIWSRAASSWSMTSRARRAVASSCANSGIAPIYGAAA
ncbi:hypothetical protein ACFY1L_55320 [Streptomyces sp. NPDC001663]|uniref:hypothetical protein n=1 Tax=Streptomyces sp. NPDC001663 TaxID=3364597 RepID=UPI0036854CD9